MDDVLSKAGEVIVDIVSDLFHPEKWPGILSREGFFWAAFVAVFVIVFTETGLLVGFFLPGDSLLVTVGVVAYGANWPIYYVIPALWVAAIAGDSCGYLIGRTVGPKVFQKEKSFFFRKKYLLMAQDFYEKHGGKTIIFAKFVPIIRTFAPVVAGAGRMHYPRFLAYSCVGAVSWITSMILLGYTLSLWLDPLLEAIFGRKVEVVKNIDKVIIVVVLVSVLPLMFKAGKSWRAKRRAAALAAVSPSSPAV